MVNTVNASRLIFDGVKQCLFLQKTAIPSVKLNSTKFAEILLASICGSDIHTITGRRSEPTPSVLGHEAVIKLDNKRWTFSIYASGCSSLSDPQSKCDICKYVSNPAIPQKCQLLFKYGHSKVSNDIDNLEMAYTGAYASHVVIRQGTTLCAIPDCISDELAATINCSLATMINALSKAPSSVDGFGNAVILGDGLLAMYGAMILKEELGYNNVYIFGNTRSFRSELIQDFGFIPDYSRNNVSRLNGKVDVVVETAGNKKVLQGVNDLLRPGGSLILVGLVLPDSHLPFSCEDIIRKNLTLHGIHNYSGKDLEKAVDFLVKANNKYDLKRIMGPIFELDKFDDAFKAAQSKKYYRVFIRP
ncbi:hypothetical protein GJ496_008593 [Pomphorhynchus laevis]|nr:hypothetical protein GJ496_008593 [Pomphorhynchus laevis]